MGLAHSHIPFSKGGVTEALDYLSVQSLSFKKKGGVS
jgi:hypothetical protein